VTLLPGGVPLLVHRVTLFGRAVTLFARRVTLRVTLPADNQPMTEVAR
jgi:hypothetical protein